MPAVQTGPMPVPAAVHASTATAQADNEVRLATLSSPLSARRDRRLAAFAAGLAVALARARRRRYAADALLPAPTTTPLPADVTGAGTSSGGASAGSDSATGTGTIVRTLVGLAIVLAVIYGLYWLLKSLPSRARPSATTAGST